MRDGVVEGPKHEHAYEGQHRRTGEADGRQARSEKSRHDEVRDTKKADPEDMRGGQKGGNGIREDQSGKKARSSDMAVRV